MIPVLLYHSTPQASQQQAGGLLLVPGMRLREQMAHVQRGEYQALFADGYLSELKEGRATGGKALLITFDDGYEDNYHVAFPLLKGLGWPAVFFVSIDYVGRTWQFNHTLVPALRRGQIKEMAAAGMTFGSHGCSHRPLTALALEEVRRELMDSKRSLEEALGREVTIYLIPTGPLMKESNAWCRKRVMKRPLAWRVIRQAVQIATACRASSSLPRMALGDCA